MINVKQEALNGYQQIKPYIRETILDYSSSFSRMTGSKVYLKCENYQYASSFKVRGALNKLLSLTAKQHEQGIVAASTGNHGAAVAFGLKKLNIPGSIFVPLNASQTKINNIKNYNVPVKLYGNDCLITEMYARDYAKLNNIIYISPYNDSKVIGGQGTIGIELSNQLKDIDAIFVPVGGGGLIAGIAGYIKETLPKTTIIGCLPENSPVLYESIQAGKIIEIETKPTLSDSTAGGLEPESITFELCQKYVDNYILVSEQEIKFAILSMIENQHILIEGGAAVALAAFLKEYKRYQNKNVVIILSGANISLEALKSSLSENF